MNERQWWLIPSTGVTGNFYVGYGVKSEENMRVVVAGKDTEDAEQLAKRIVRLLNADVLPVERKEDDVLRYCSVCGDWQNDTPSGLTCRHGHGASPTVDAVKATALRAKWRRKSEEESRNMNWEKVAGSLREQADDAVRSVEVLSARVVTNNTGEVHAISDAAMVERVKTIERHRINANFCISLARALEAGLGE